MKIPSGDITVRVPFIAVDETDLLSPLTGLTAFTVLRNRNGNGAVAMTAPTIVEADAINAPGEYWLLVNEDTALEAGVGEHTMTLNITHAGMFRARCAVVITAVHAKLPDALEDGFIKSATKKVGPVILTPSGAGGQKIGG